LPTFPCTGPRAWELRDILTAHDAVYIALAEALDAPLLTRDRRLAGAAGHRARVGLV
jgi:predicted nucleic acid-binding protein